MVTSFEDLVNQGLRSGGLPLRVEDIYEGSNGARVALEIVGEARDELLIGKDWSFNRGSVSLTKLKGPPPAGGFSPAQPWSNIYAPPGFVYSYAYPADCLQVRAIYEPPGLFPDSDPIPASWRIDDDPLPNVVGGVATGPEAKVILCNETNAMLSYWRQVTNMNLWTPAFVGSLVAELGVRFSKAFGSDAQTNRENATEAVATIQTAAQSRG